MFPEAKPGLTGRLLIRRGAPTTTAIALRSLTNERGDFLLTTMPVVPTLDTDIRTSSTIVFPHIVDGDGYKTELILLNPSQYAGSTSVVRFVSDQGTPFPIAAVRSPGRFSEVGSAPN